jgi:hypothetical protein
VQEFEGGFVSQGLVVHAISMHIHFLWEVCHERIRFPLWAAWFHAH